MKYVQLVLTMLLVICLVSTGAIASKGKTTNGVKGVDDAGRPISISVSKSKPDPMEFHRQDAAVMQELSKAASIKAPLSMPSSPVEVTGFSGEVHVGAAQGLKTIADVVFVLNFGAPLNGNTTFLLDDATYTEPGCNLGPISYGPGGPYTATFRPNTGVSVTSTVTCNSTGGIILTGSSNVIFEGTAKGGTPGGDCGDPAVRNWHIVPAAYVSSTQGTIAITNGSSFVTLADLNIEGINNGTTTNGTRAISITNTNVSAPQHDITVRNCEVHNGREGITSAGRTDVIPLASYLANCDYAFSIKGNDIHDLAQKGIFLNQAISSYIFCNKVKDIVRPATFASSSGRQAGIQATNDYDTRIVRNTVDNVDNLRTTESSATNGRCYGIRSQGFPVATDPSFDLTNTRVRIINNCITRVLGQGAIGTFRSIGIEDGGGERDSLVHNTVYMTGTAGPNFEPSCCVQIFEVGRGAFTADIARSMSFNNLYANDRASGGKEHVCIRPFDDSGPDYRALSDYNVLYSPNPDGEVAPGYANVPAFIGYNTNDSHSAGWNPYMLTANDCHWDVLQPSSASNTGKPGRAADDLLGNARSATAPDCGAIEEVTDAPLFHDAYTSAIVSPSPAGMPNGLPFSPFTATVSNSTLANETSVSVNIKVYDPVSTLVYDGNGSGGPLGPLGTVDVTMTSPTGFTPTTAGTYTLVACVTLAADGDASNDCLTVEFPVAGIKNTFPYCTGFETVGDRDGWFGTGDWAIDNTFTKLGGPRAGAYGAVTVPGPDGTPYNDLSCGKRDFLLTPFFDLTLVPNPTVSFFQSLKTEPVWDGGRFEYSIDTGKTWHIMGGANSGINWYGGAYSNANNADVNCWGPGFGGAGNCAAANLTDFGMHETPKWTSNGDCEGADSHTGPNGYVYVQYTDAAGDFGGKNYVRFRYNTFFDGGAGDDGIAIDDFCLSATAPSWTGSICGVKFGDTNGNGVQDPGENTIPGTLVLSYFGVALETLATDGGGNYCFLSLPPGEYTVTSLKPAGVAVTSGGVIVQGGNDHPIFNVGNYQGSICGQKFNDVNNNGVKDGGEGGLAGWTIELHADSCNGALVGTEVTDANGNYCFTAAPGTYCLKEVLQANWVQTFPGGGTYTIVISGPSGSPTSNVTGVDFGNWQLGCIRINKFVDLNGDGVQQGGDVTAMPVGATAIFDVKKDAIHLLYDTLGNNVSSVQHCGLAPGTYTVAEIFSSPGWVITLGGLRTVVVATSGVNSVQTFLNFDMPSACGHKFEDTNGNGVQDPGEPGLAGWKINISGSVYGSSSAVTDANGDWCIDSLGGGPHVISEVLQLHWTQTFPVGGTYSFNGTSANVPGANKVNQNFGNFKNICISGVKYRDRNNNGVRDAGEEGMAGVTISVTGTGASSTNTAADGSWQICDVGPGNHTVSETPIPGFTQTQPPLGAPYTINPATSGVDVAGLDFGNFQDNDASYKYRTFTADDWVAAAQIKAAKRPTTKKPTVPNIRNVVKDFFAKGQGLSVLVGVPGQDIKKGPPFVLITKESNFLKSLWDKGVEHGNIYRGFTTNNAGTKLLLGKQTSLSAKVHSNDAFEEAVVLALNLQLSLHGKTPAGLGNLIYNDGVDESALSYCVGFPLNGKTIDQIMAQASLMLTNSGSYLAPCYQRLADVIANINHAFGCAVAGEDCEGSLAPTIDSAIWWSGAKLFTKGLHAVTEVPYLHANPSAVPVVIPTPEIAALPDQYELYQNYPNPFNPTTSIDFDLPEGANVTLKIYNLLGQEVATLLNHEQYDAGSQTVDFDASQLSSGVYVYRLVAEGMDDDNNVTGQVFTQTKKMLLMK